MAAKAHIAFSFIGGQHQFLHGAPALAAVTHHPDVSVEAFVPDADDAAALREILTKLGAGAVQITEMTLPGPLETLARRDGQSGRFKVPRLLWWNRRMRAANLIVTLERTSTLLKRLPGHCPLMAHIPHGAGDNARGYDKRIRLFDYVLVAGEKDRERMIDFGLAKPDRVAATGYLKLAGLKRMYGARMPRLFDNDRPTVLYNPHWLARMTSWPNWGESVIAQFAADRRFNLIVAPHIRLLEEEPAEVREKLNSRSDPDWLLIDTGSPRSMDMTYTLGADIYLGDISSQVYEFCSIPRPCVFLDTYGEEWRDDPHFAMWHLGEVVSEKSALMPAIEAAWKHPDRKRNEQVSAVRNSFGDPDVDAAEVAAKHLISLAQGVIPTR